MYIYIYIYVYTDISVYNPLSHVVTKWAKHPIRSQPARDTRRTKML